jgi:SAM-dependent methyltransferase
MRRIIAALTKRWGSQAAKQNVWDAEYGGGKWDCLGTDPMRPAGTKDPVYMFLDKYSAGASVLDLGSGNGMTVTEMAECFREYVGVDISSVAVEKAKEALQNDPSRARKTKFFVSDIANFIPDQEFSVILFRESIYYVPQRQMTGMLDHYCSFLAVGGVFIVRLCNRNKYKGIVKLLETKFQIVEKYAPDDSITTIIVCSPRKARPIA